MHDIERLIESTLPFVEELLMEYGEFFPLASAIQTNDTISQIGIFDGDEQPLSSHVIENYKTAFKAKKEEYKTIAIFHDVRVIDPKTNIKTDAVAIFTESKNDSIAYTLFYPYTLTSDKILAFSDPWLDENQKEIFID